MLHAITTGAYVLRLEGQVKRDGDGRLVMPTKISDLDDLVTALEAEAEAGLDAEELADMQARREVSEADRLRREERQREQAAAKARRQAERRQQRAPQERAALDALVESQLAVPFRLLELRQFLL